LRVDLTQHLEPRRLDLFRRCHDDVDGHPDVEEVRVEIPGQLIRIGDVGLDDEQVEVTVRTQLPARGGPKQDHLIRLGNSDDSTDDLPQGRNIVLNIPL
jgi:hypothetical protein